MGANTKIEWAHHTFNPWIGCTALSPACDNCYAEALVARWGGDFATRRRTSNDNWKLPPRWNRRAERLRIRYRVFSASLADIFDNKVPKEWRADLWALIRATPHLDWLLLTKRPQNINAMLPDDWGDGYPNVWLGTTVENQEEADRRIPALLEIPARVHFLSCEPLLGPLDIGRWIGGEKRRSRWLLRWVIAGGESGHHARPMHPVWLRSLRDQCFAASVAFHFKQWGEYEPYELIDDERPEPWRRDSSGRESWLIHEFHLQNLEKVKMVRVGKKRAGRQLDGREWNELPLQQAA